MTLERVGSRYYLGLDLGQARDYSAIAIAERRTELTGERDHVTYLDHTTTRILVTHLERIPLRTSYPQTGFQPDRGQNSTIGGDRILCPSVRLSTCFSGHSPPGALLICPEGRHFLLKWFGS